MRERRFITRTASIGRMSATFKTELIEGCEPLDTEVILDGSQLCWITRADIDTFTTELNQVISKYQI